MQHLRLSRYVLTMHSVRVRDQRFFAQAWDPLFERFVAIKGVLGSLRSPEVEGLEQEFLLLRRLSHPRLPEAFALANVTLPTVSEPWSEQPLRFFTQAWLEGPTLRNTHLQSPQQVRHVLKDVLELMVLFHAEGFCRFDLTLDHLILTARGWNWVDLELMARAHGSALEGLGTPAYLSPEVLAGEPYAQASDIYSLGTVVWEAIAQYSHSPEGTNLPDLASWRYAHPHPLLPEAFRREDPTLAHLIEAMVALDPRGRPSARAVLAQLRLGQSETREPKLTRPLIRPPLVAFQPLLQEAEQWRQASVLSGGALQVCGPAGSGRSRLLEELAEVWQSQGLPVLHLSPRTLPTPSHLFFNALLMALDPTSTPCEFLLDPKDEMEVRNRQEEYIVQMMQRLMEAAKQARERHGQPILLLLDDTGRLEEVSQRIFSRLIPLVERVGLQLVYEVVMPWEEPRAVSPIKRLWTQPLILQDALELRESLELRRPERVDQTHELLEATQGRAGAFVHCVWRMCTLGVPDPLSELSSEPEVITRLRLLSPQALSDSTALSVLDREVDEELATLLLNLDGGHDEAVGGTDTEGRVEPSVVERLAPLEAVGILISSEAQGGTKRWYWAAPTERDTFRQQLSTEYRRALSLMAAECLESRAMEDPTQAEPLSQVLLLAGEPIRARPWLQRAAEQAERALLLERAEARLSQLHSTWKSLPPSLSEQQLKQAQLLYAQGAMARALARSDTLASDSRATPLLRARAALVKGRSLIALERYDEADSTLRGVLECGLPPAEQILLLHALSWLALKFRRLDACLPLLEQASSHLITLNCSPERIKAEWPELPEPHRRLYLEHLRYQTWCLTESLEDPEAPSVLTLVKQLDDALRLAASPDTDASRLNVMEAQSELLARLGRPGEAVRVGALALELCRKRLMLQQEANARVNLSRYERDQGQRTRSLEQLEHAVRLYRSLNNVGGEVRVLLNQADLQLEEGQLKESERTLTQVDERIRTLPSTQGIAQSWWVMTRIRLKMRQGLDAVWDTLRPEEVDARLANIYTLLQNVGQPAMARVALVDRLEWAVRSIQDEEVLHEPKHLEVLWREASRLENPLFLLQDPHTWHRLHGLLARLHSHFENGLRSRLHLTPQTGWQETLAPTLTGPVPGARGANRSIDLHLLSCVRAIDEGEERLAAELARLLGDQFQGRGVIGLRGQGEFKILRGHGIEPEHTRRVSRQLMWQVAESRQSVLCFDVKGDPDISSLQTIRQSRASSVLCWPILHHQECLGVLYVDRRTPFEQSEAQAKRLMDHVARLAGELLASLRRRQQRDDEPAPVYEGLIGDSPAMRTLRREIAEVLRANSNVILLDGETGTGKTTVAGILHREGSRRGLPMMTPNILNIPAGTFESEVFGHCKGAFTGAISDHIGFLEAANGSTLFLDEIGEFPLDFQKKLLTALEKKCVRRMGDTRDREANFVLITATHRDLFRDVQNGLFRQDLLYRLRGTRLHIPSLRERGPDEIAQHCIHQIGRILERKLPDGAQDLDPYFEPDAADYLLYRHSWPGNVRELANLIESAPIKTRLMDRHRISRELVAKHLQEQPDSRPPVLPPPGMNLEELKGWYKQLRQRYVMREFERDGGNVSKTAQRMGGISLRSQLIKIRDGKD